ncbi:MAG TPA: diphthine--ammonia ligase [Thermoplasmata archaeon]|nr:diphthine--ammonia ligase [Thermoplasmata archaeon]
MTVTALVSGGKDSIYAAYLAECQGWPVDELVTVVPQDPDAMLFHTPNLDLVALQAEAWGKTARRVPVRGTGEGPELEALEKAIGSDRGPVVVGAIQSSYQWARVVRVADRAHRRVYAPLWRVRPARVVREEIAAGLDIRLVHLAAEPLTPELLGRRLDKGLVDELERRSREVRPVNVAGEGGEFETLVVDAPFFRGRIEAESVERVVARSTAQLRIGKARIVPKGRPTPGDAAQ